MYFYFQKTFDKVSHSKIMFKVKQFGVNDNVHNWTKNLLSSRKQRVVINDITSDSASVTSGVL